MKQDYRKISRIIIYCTGAFALLTIGLFLFNRLSSINRNLPVDTSLLADYGTLVGGLATAALTIASIYLIIQTINEQKIFFDTQQNSQQIYFNKNEVEQRIFEFIRLYRENVNEVSGKGYEGRNLFIMIRNEILDALEIVQKHLTSDSDYNEDFVGEKNKANIDMAFMLVYFGTSTMTDEYLLTTFKSDYCNEAKAKIILQDVRAVYKEIKANNEAAKTDHSKAYKYLPFDGHQSRLGHYFRHLYHTVTFVNNLPDDLYPFDEKYKYVKMLRGQISNHEQAIIFFNSLSRLGNQWEVAHTEESKKLITNYALIKNIPDGFTGKLRPQDFYPNIKYEDIDRKKV